MGCQWLAGLIASSNNSGGVVVGAIVYGTECSGFKSRLILQPLLLEFKFS